jgi:hypothetical protein
MAFLGSLKMADGLDSLLLALCVRDDSFGKLPPMGFFPEMLVSPEGREAFEYCLLLKSKGEKPSILELESRFSVSPKIPDGATLEGVFRSIKDRSLTREIKLSINDSIKLIASGNPTAALDRLVLNAKLRGKYSTRASDVLSYRLSFTERLLYYMTVKDSGGFLGAVTRWPTFNRETRGIINGYFYVFAGFTSVGKSWMLMLLCEDLLSQKRRPLVVSTEMEPKRLQMRLDCLRYKLPYVDLRDGCLTPEMEEKWIRAMYEESLMDVSDAIFVGKKEVKTVQDISLMAKDLGVTDVLVDGGYRLASSREWGDQSKLVQDFQVCAEDSNIPWVATVQLGDSSETGKGLDSKLVNRWNVRYAKEWIIDPDVVVGLSQPPDLSLINRMHWSMLKVRDGSGKPREFDINWNKDTGDYSEVDPSVDIAKSEVSLDDLAAVSI